MHTQRQPRIACLACLFESQGQARCSRLCLSKLKYPRKNPLQPLKPTSISLPQTKKKKINKGSFVTKCETKQVPQSKNLDSCLRPVGYVLKKQKELENKTMTGMRHGSRQQLGFCFLKRSGGEEAAKGESSYFQGNPCTAYLFRPNNTLTGRYERKRTKEKKRKRNKRKLETHQNKNNFDSMFKN